MHDQAFELLEVGGDDRWALEPGAVVGVGDAGEVEAPGVPLEDGDAATDGALVLEADDGLRCAGQPLAGQPAQELDEERRAGQVALGRRAERGRVAGIIALWHNGQARLEQVATDLLALVVQVVGHLGEEDNGPVP